MKKNWIQLQPGMSLNQFLARNSSVKQPLRIFAGRKGFVVQNAAVANTTDAEETG